MIERERLSNAFREHFGREPRLFRAPGRVNLIGEHTDYNDGFVLPMAINRETVIAAAPRADQRVRVRALNFDEDAEFDLDSPSGGKRGTWLDYVEGVAQSLQQRTGVRLKGADLMVLSDVPLGAGLSSSAALEISAGLALLSMSGAQDEVNGVALALAGQQAEHTYVGTLCGIMDQFIAALGRAGHALLIDCRTLEAKHLPLDTSRAVVVICDTNVKHELSSSEYNARRAECERGVSLLQQVSPEIKALRDVTPEFLRQHEELLPEPVRRRCRHVVTENERTLSAADALTRGDLEEMGRLMDRSHKSLRDDYEVSCFELDALVEIAGNFGACLGARMTGGGFGGSTVNLVLPEAVEEFKEMITREYTRATNITPTIYVSDAGDGAKEIETGGVER